jgi:argininosuccinate lyase
MNYSYSRFQKDTNKLVQGYVASIPFDQQLYHQDIEGSIAHVKMLAKQGIIAESEARK